MKLNFFNNGKTTAQILSTFNGLVDELKGRIAQLSAQEAANNVVIDDLQAHNKLIAEECLEAATAIQRIQQLTGKE